MRDIAVESLAQFTAERIIRQERYSSDPYANGLINTVRDELLRFYDKGQEEVKKPKPRKKKNNGNV